MNEKKNVRKIGTVAVCVVAVTAGTGGLMAAAADGRAAALVVAAAAIAGVLTAVAIGIQVTLARPHRISQTISFLPVLVLAVCSNYLVLSHRPLYFTAVALAAAAVGMLAAAAASDARSRVTAARIGGHRS